MYHDAKRILVKLLSFLAYIRGTSSCFWWCCYTGTFLGCHSEVMCGRGENSDHTESSSTANFRNQSIIGLVASTISSDAWMQASTSLPNTHLGAFRMIRWTRLAPLNTFGVSASVLATLISCATSGFAALGGGSQVLVFSLGSSLYLSDSSFLSLIHYL